VRVFALAVRSLWHSRSSESDKAYFADVASQDSHECHVGK